MPDFDDNIFPRKTAVPTSCSSEHSTAQQGSILRRQSRKRNMGRRKKKRGQCSKMSLSGKREEGDQVSKMSLSGGHDTKARSPFKQERPASPVPSCVSMKSDQSMDQPLHFGKGDFSTEQSPIKKERPASPVPSCVSMKSDQSMDQPLHFREGDFSTEQRNQQERSESEILSGQSSQSHQTDLASIFTLLEEKIMTFVKNELKMFKRILSPELPEGFESQKQDKEVVDAEDEKQESSAREGALQITLHVLRKMNQKELADTLEKCKICLPHVACCFITFKSYS
ncbi:uncharacterized protein ACWYII_007204 [Salvelinus alpinus]